MFFLKLKTPVVFINFKTYEEATGRNALALAKKASLVSKKTKKTIVLVVQAADIRLVSEKTKMHIFAQHIDAIEQGAYTGWTSPAAVKEAGAIGTVLNHAEHKLDNSVLEKSIALAKKNSLLVMACAENLERAEQIAGFESKPDFIAIEPPELISGNVSVSTARPGLVSDSAEAIKKIAPEIKAITGAGIKNSFDVSKAIELGTLGVFVASGIVKAPNQQKAILEIVSGLKK
ncbi:MAG TPA: triose-phosphate isomerase [archaeon]|nr:triose-phosphate isomerase [archaeon]